MRPPLAECQTCRDYLWEAENLFLRLDRREVLGHVFTIQIALCVKCARVYDEKRHKKGEGGTMMKSIGLFLFLLCVGVTVGPRPADLGHGALSLSDPMVREAFPLLKH